MPELSSIDMQGRLTLIAERAANEALENRYPCKKGREGFQVRCKIFRNETGDKSHLIRHGVEKGRLAKRIDKGQQA